MKRKRKLYTRRCWGEFTDGRLHLHPMDNSYGGFGHGEIIGFAIFTDKARALKEYEDVRRIEIREIKPSS